MTTMRELGGTVAQAQGEQHNFRTLCGDYTVPQLKGMLREKGLLTSGLKADLARRLAAAGQDTRRRTPETRLVLLRRLVCEGWEVPGTAFAFEDAAESFLEQRVRRRR